MNFLSFIQVSGKSLFSILGERNITYVNERYISQLKKFDNRKRYFGIFAWYYIHIAMTEA